MKTKIIIAVLALIFVQGLKAQMPAKDPEAAIRFLADKILSQTSWELINQETGELYANSDHLPVSESIKVKSERLDWRYQNGVLNIAMMMLGDLLEEPKYSNYTKSNYNFVARHYGYFKMQFDDTSIMKSSLAKLYDFNYLDDCGTMTAGLIESGLAGGNSNDLYKEIIDRTTDYIMHKEFRLKDGTLCREYPRKGAVWADDLYMSVIFLSKMGDLTGDIKYFNEAVKQIKKFKGYLMDDQSGLYNHAYFDDIQETNGAFWGRANGWVMMAQVELLSVLPENYSGREELLQILKKFIRGVARVQSSNGLWHQLLDKNDSFLESSCTAMFTYSIAKAVNNGWIDGVWSQVAWKGWRGLYSNITEDAQVKDICVGTHIEWNQSFYYHRPVSVNDTHGLASTILAGIEVVRMSKKYNERVNPRSF